MFKAWNCLKACQRDAPPTLIERGLFQRACEPGIREPRDAGQPRALPPG